MRSPVARLRNLAVRTSERVAHALTGPGRGEPAGDGRPRVFFVVHNKNHVTIFAPVAQRLEAKGLYTQFVTICGHRFEAQAVAALKGAGLAGIDLGEMGRIATVADAVCLGNDWGPKRLRAWLARLEARGVALVGVVEGARFGLPRLYRTVNHLLCWGASGLEIGARGARVVGSPIIEASRSLAGAGPRANPVHALVNYKFSGTAEDEGFVWGAAVIAAARAIDPEYVLSTHPSSRGVPADVRVSHAPFPALLAQSTVLITKASTVIYEALAAGVSVLYYPAEGEARAEFGDPRGAFQIAESPDHLLELARAYAAAPAFPAQAAADFLARHVFIDPARPAVERMADAITEIVRARAHARGA